MNWGSRELTRLLAAYLASLTFVLAFLVTIATGGSGLTALMRGGVCCVIMLMVGRLLMQPLISTILNAMARDRSEKEAAS